MLAAPSARLVWPILAVLAIAAGLALQLPVVVPETAQRDACTLLGLAIMAFGCVVALPRQPVWSSPNLVLGGVLILGAFLAAPLSDQPLSASVSLLLLGLSSLASGRTRLEGRAMTVLPAVLLGTLALVMILEPWHERPLRHPWLDFVGDLPLAAELALLLAAAAAITRAWYFAVPLSGGMPGWLGLLCSALTAALAIGGWQFLQDTELRNQRNRAAEHERALETLVRSEFELNLKAFQRLADRWSSRAALQPPALQQDLDAYRRDFVGIAGIAILRRDGSALASSWGSGALPLGDPALLMLAQKCVDLQAVRTSPPITKAGTAHGLVAMPLPLGSDAGDGVLLIDQTLDTTLEGVLGNFIGTFEVEIYDGSVLLFEDGGEKGPTITAPGANGGVTGRDWTFKARPHGGGSTADQGPLPVVLLGSGLLSALLVGTTIHFAQSSARRARTALDARGQLEALLDATDQVAIIATDLSGDITVFNAGAEALTGRRAAQLIGADTPLFMLAPDEREALEQDHPNLAFRALIDALRGDRMHLHTWAVQRSDGTIRRVSMAASSWTGPDGTPLGHLIVAVDMTDQVAALEEATSARENAERANAAKSQFLANVSHEIRTPMSAILGYADALLDPATSDMERDECVRVIRRNGNHLLGIINDILDISKIEAGRMTIERIEVRPVQLIDDVVALVRGRVLAKGLELRVEAEPSASALVVTDPLRVRQVLMNLVTNSIKFTETGSVSVRARVKADGASSELEFTVADTGLGMSPEQVGRLFRSFEQGDASTSRKFGGTGLGLAISHKLVELLGGSVEVSSEPGAGSTFIVRIPVGLPWASAQAQSLAGSRILLAEDGPDNARLLAALLRKAGAIVTVAHDGAAAIDAVSTSGLDGFDVVLMDLQMPGVDGYEACRRLRALGVTIPIIALTGNAFEEDRDRCLASGFDQYAVKPIPRDQLLQLCEDALKARKGPPPSGG
ncbi:MAG: response regulator [Planctomycetes bacterium]|nr:response regulator [Planctomycetota bacterium]